MTTFVRLDGTVPLALCGLRADQALARIFPQHSRTRIQEWIRAGAATLDGTPIRGKDRVTGGERVSIRCTIETDDESAAQPGPLCVLHEDPDLLVLDKPPGLVVHPGAGNREGTLLNRLLAYDSRLRDIPRAGLVHRLDKDTSGLMVVARSLRAHTSLVARLKAREIERTYEAIVTGEPPQSATIAAAIGRDRVHRTRMAVDPRGKHAVTHIRLVERYPGHARLAVRIETGRTHQIRVHLSYQGYPIVGDATYGKRASRRRSGDSADAVSTFPRQALHACRLSLDHPVTNQPLVFAIAAPPDIRMLIESLRAESIAIR